MTYSERSKLEAIDMCAYACAYSGRSIFELSIFELSLYLLIMTCLSSSGEDLQRGGDGIAS